MTDSPRRPTFSPQSEDQAQAGFQGLSPVPFSRIAMRHHGRLPHWEKECGLYFVTFRTYDSLPKHLFEAARRGFHPTPNNRHLGQRVIEEMLDKGSGLAFFSDQRCATVMAETLRDRRNAYRLLAWCVMPNHVHFLWLVSGSADAPATVGETPTPRNDS